jgi:hypothetical protein
MSAQIRRCAKRSEWDAAAVKNPATTPSSPRSSCTSCGRKNTTWRVLWEGEKAGVRGAGAVVEPLMGFG